MRKTLAAGVLLLALLLGGCGTTVVRPTIGEPATGTVPKQTETTMPHTSAPSTTALPTMVPSTTAVSTTVPPTTAASTTLPPTTAAATEAPTTLPPTTAGQSEEQVYILNTSSKKFHLPSCGSVKNMKAENKAEFTGTREELTEMGYQPCGNCKP